MNRTWSLVIAGLALVTLCAGATSAGDVNINVGWPPPLIVETPRVVVVPETRVYRAPSLEFNVFVFGGKYYSLHNDRWYMAARVGAPWTPLIVEHVPAEVRAVPVKYYKIPPGHLKHQGYAKKAKDEDSAGRGKGCPPGLAKQGRC